MSQADALLASLSETPAVHEHIVTDPDHRFVIDPDTRVITNLTQSRNTLMQYDHNSEVYTFELPRYIESHDMTLCNRARVHFINIDSETGVEYPDVAEMDNPVVDPTNPSRVTAIWTIRREATQLAGNLSFAVQFMCVAPDGTVTYEWHTDIYSDVDVKRSLDNGEASVVQYSNILEEWYQKLFSAGNSVADDAITRIETKAEEVLASIPEDYTTTHNMAEEALRKKANAIIPEAEGDAIFVNDSSDSALIGLKMFGKTVQDGMPTPDAPVELVSLGNADSVNTTLLGKNLINIRRTDIGKVNSTVVVAGESITVATSVDDAYARAVIPVTYPLNTPLTISFDATILQGSGFMASTAMQVYMRKGNTASKVVNLEMTADKRSYIVEVTDGIPDPGYSLWLYIKTSASFVGKVEVKYENIQIEVGSTATTYEPYVEPQTLAVSTPNGLPGIPATSDANYTDVNGQQWICDEIDLERGVYVQRVKTKTFTGGDMVGWHQLATYGSAIRFDYTTGKAKPRSKIMANQLSTIVISTPNAEGINVHSSQTHIQTQFLSSRLPTADMDGFAAYLQSNPLTILYALNDPIETPLTDEEIANFKMVCTNYHNTTVFNDAGAHMAIKYNADTKRYVDGHSASEDQVARAVAKYLADNPVSGETLIDSVTGKSYQLTVVNGKLTLVSLGV